MRVRVLVLFNVFAVKKTVCGRSDARAVRRRRGRGRKKNIGKDFTTRGKIINYDNLITIYYIIRLYDVTPSIRTCIPPHRPGR